jgi:hypothetical protein
MKNPKKQAANDLIHGLEKGKSKDNEHQLIVENDIEKQMKIEPEMETKKKKDVKIK